MHWIVLVLGLWVAVSPWLVEAFGVAQLASNVVVGGTIALISLWSIFGKVK